MAAGFPWEQVLPLLPLNKTICRGILGPEVGTQGSGPCDEAVFDEFLVECGIHVRLVSGGAPPPVAIFGRDSWDEDDVDELWQQTLGQNIRVYSQEMVLASMAIGVDVVEQLNGATGDFIGGHPALERFFYGVPEPDEVVFPDTGVPEATQRKLLVSFDTGAWPSSGVLSEMGYRVGRNGLVEADRRAILADVLAVELVATSNAANRYVAEWGPPNSRQRLQKMVNAITAFARNARRKTADFSEAIADWECDLQWLRYTYR